MVSYELVTNVIDGDTIRTRERTEPIRLTGYDAPETGTLDGGEATINLALLICDQEVGVTVIGHDVYGRALAEVSVGQLSVNDYMKNMVQSV